MSEAMPLSVSGNGTEVPHANSDAKADAETVGKRAENVDVDSLKSSEPASEPESKDTDANKPPSENGSNNIVSGMVVEENATSEDKPIADGDVPVNKEEIEDKLGQMEAEDTQSTDAKCAEKKADLAEPPSVGDTKATNDEKSSELTEVDAESDGEEEADGEDDVGNEETEAADDKETTKHEKDDDAEKEGDNADKAEKASKDKEGEEEGGKQEEDEGENIPLLEQPPEVSGRRQRRAVDRFTDPSPTEVKRAKVEPEGRGTALGDCPCVAHQIQHTPVEELHSLHQLLFSRPGRANEVRNNLKTFNGFPFDKDSKEYAQKCERIQSKFTLAQMRSLVRLLDLSVTSSTKEGLVEPIAAFLCEPAPSGREVKDVQMRRKSSRKDTPQKASPADDGSDEEEDESDYEPPAKRSSRTPKKGGSKRGTPAKRTPAKSPAKKTPAKRTPAKKAEQSSAPTKKTPRKPPTERGQVPTPQRKRKRGAETERKPEGEETPAKKSKGDEQTVDTD